VGGARQALDRLGLGDLAAFDRAKQGEQLVHLHLLDVHITQAIAGEGLQVFGRLDQPAQHRVRIDLKDAGHGADTETFS
jgi:hypothetical protein